MLNIVLFEPEISQNAGNIARTCACLGASLHLVEPMGFRLSEKHLKRAAMDYWESVSVYRYASTDDFLIQHENDELFFFTGQATQLHTQIKYGENPYLIFGRESRGVDVEILERFKDSCIRIPMLGKSRSLNLSNAAAIGAYEVARQWNFQDLK